MSKETKAQASKERKKSVVILTLSVLQKPFTISNLMFCVKFASGPVTGAARLVWSAPGKLVPDSHTRGGTDHQAGNVARLTHVVLIVLHHAWLLMEGGPGDPGSSGEMTNSHVHKR